MWSCLLLMCCGAAPIFDARADNPWDELRDVFYVRHFTTGEVYEHELSLDSAPWRDWARFYNDEAFYNQVIARLQAFLAQSKAQVEEQPALRRAILLRDLWSVFEAQTREYLAKTPLATKRQAELRNLLAKVMRRLELTEDEARRLPDNYKAAIESKQFPAGFDLKSPDAGFLPPDLFDEAGPWVAISGGKKGIGAETHAQTAKYRSIFVPYIRVSSDRQETIDFIRRYADGRGNVVLPEGTLLALARRMTLPTTSGRIAVTPVMESLQLTVRKPPPRDLRFKFAFDRRKLLASETGLRMLTNDDPLDDFGFESGGLRMDGSKFDADGEQLVLGRFVGPSRVRSLQHCAGCHGPTTFRLFANAGNLIMPAVSTWDAEARKIVAQQEQSASWKMYESARK